MLLLCLLLMPSFLSAKDAAVQKEHLVFTPVTLTGSDISSSLMKKAVTKITDQLDGEDFFVINPAQSGSDKITPGRCLEKKCIPELAEIAPEGIVIIISVTSEKVKTDEKVVSRYMAADAEQNKYTIHVKTVDVLKKEYELTFTRTVYNSTLILKEADSIGKSIRKHYIKQKPPAVPVSKTGEDQPDKDDDAGDIFEIPGVFFNISMLFPFGEFSDIAEYGIGCGAALNSRFLPLPFISVNPGITFYWLSPGTENIESGYMVLPELTFGFNIQVSEAVILTPAFGAGYSFMFIDGTNADSSGMEFYYNPALKAGLEASYILSSGHLLFASGSYRCIFESDSLLQSAEIKTGIRVKFQ